MMHSTSSRDERGFSLIELLTVIGILGILASLSLSAFSIYRESAEYSKGDATMHSARTALYAGELDLGEDFTMAYTTSTTTGGALVGPMAQALPGMIMTKDLRLGVEVNACDDSSGPFDRAQFIVAQPCRATRELRYEKFCGGSEVILENVANPAPCS